MSFMGDLSDFLESENEFNEHHDYIEDEGIMGESSEVIYTTLYVLFTICLIAPPTEVVSAGLTLQNIFRSILGSEELNFVYYHVKRTAITALVHSFIPLGYYIGLSFASHHHKLLQWTAKTLFWKCYILLAVILVISNCALVLYWRHKRWINHPLLKTLLYHCSTENPNVNSLVSNINQEFRRVDKFAAGVHGRQVIVTDSWIIKTSTYTVDVAFQSDVHLTLSHAEEHALSTDSGTGTQYLNISVGTVRPNVNNFTIRLNALDFGDLRNKLQAPVRNARNVIIRQTLSDMFLDAFRMQIERNGPFHKPRNMEIDTCIGCMQKDADVKLVKKCDEELLGECQQCHCRPMWCLECMGKWFASRQIQGEHQPDTWMSNSAPCPTCRARFCMLDICNIV